MSTPIRTRLRPPAVHTLAALCAASCVALQPAAAATFDAATLSGVPANSGTATFSTPGWSGFVLTLRELSTSTLMGSDLFGYEGLWLGADGTGGQYSFQFSAPVASIAFSFIALTAFADGPTETLTTFAASAAVNSSLSAADGTSTWSGVTLTPLEEDSHGLLTFTARAPEGITSLRFDHVQPGQLQGFVVNRIDVTPAAVPEPAAAWLMTLGLLGGWQLNRVRRVRQRTAPAGDAR